MGLGDLGQASALVVDYVYLHHHSGAPGVQRAGGEPWVSPAEVHRGGAQSMTPRTSSLLANSMRMPHVSAKGIRAEMSKAVSATEPTLTGGLGTASA